MANKHVTKPCAMSGKDVPTDSTIGRNYLNGSSVIICPTCNGLVALNKSNNKLRLHNDLRIEKEDHFSEVVEGASN